jgi:hypothetical protein
LPAGALLGCQFCGGLRMKKKEEDDDEKVFDNGG